MTEVVQAKAIELSRLHDLVSELKKCQTTREKIQALSSFAPIAGVDEEVELLLMSLVAIGQDHLLATAYAADPDFFLDQLKQVEKFYEGIGGIVGYHLTMLTFLYGTEASPREVAESFHQPPGIDISEMQQGVRQSILKGIASLSELAEIYPVGGAADRLRLFDSDSKVPLPAANLPFCGLTLLEALIRDVQAREYLHYKLHRTQVTVPIAMMTSHEKDNSEHILSQMNNAHWFGRPKDSFRFFCQPLVPSMDQEGKWCLNDKMKLMMKPGGHGVIWKVARDAGVFDWFQSEGRRKLLVRQINNPIAGLDYGLLAFTGFGFLGDKLFGFASCRRQVQAAEGVNVLIEFQKETGTEYCLTSIEYCDFKKFSIEDAPVEENSAYSKYPSNTNILFADIEAIQEAVFKRPIPGMIVNLKSIAFLDETGSLVEKPIARLESTMQNIADCFVEKNAPFESFKTFLTYNHRHKTISTAKKEYQEGASIMETPEGCFYDLMHNGWSLLKDGCGADVPVFSDVHAYLKNGPSLIFLYHPALGPLYSIIAQKILGGRFEEGSELQLEITELCLERLHLDGSLHIKADRVLGHLFEGKISYSENVGRCLLSNVNVINEGIDRGHPQSFWKNRFKRNELCQILIRGNGEFVATDVTLKGNQTIVVEDGMRLTVTEVDGELVFNEEAILEPSWHWAYCANDDDSIILEKLSPAP